MIRGEDHISNTPKHILAVPGARPRGPGLRPPAADPQPRPDEDEQAQEPDRGRRLLAARASSAKASSTTSRSSAGARAPRRRSSGSTSSSPGSTSTRSTRAARVFDRERLEWLNGQWIRRLEPDELVDRLRPFLEAAAADGRIDRLPSDDEIRALAADRPGAAADPRRDRRPRRVPLRRPTSRSTRRSSCRSAGTPRRPATGWRRPRDDDRAPLRGRAFEADELEPPLRALAEARGWKAGDLFMAIRVAVTGRTATPPLFDTLVALGRERTLLRLDAAIATLDAEPDRELLAPAGPLVPGVVRGDADQRTRLRKPRGFRVSMNRSRSGSDTNASVVGSQSRSAAMGPGSSSCQTGLPPMSVSSTMR